MFMINTFYIIASVRLREDFGIDEYRLDIFRPSINHLDALNLKIRNNILHN